VLWNEDEPRDNVRDKAFGLARFKPAIEASIGGDPRRVDKLGGISNNGGEGSRASLTCCIPLRSSGVTVLALNGASSSDPAGEGIRSCNDIVFPCPGRRGDWRRGESSGLSRSKCEKREALRGRFGDLCDSCLPAIDAIMSRTGGRRRLFAVRGVIGDDVPDAGETVNRKAGTHGTVGRLERSSRLSFVGQSIVPGEGQRASSSSTLPSSSSRSR
jgi:hypothetical protein